MANANEKEVKNISTKQLINEKKKQKNRANRMK